MKVIYPNYYSKFKCVADKCKHSCCVGWEIDIDSETMKMYNSLEGKFAEKIRANIDGEVPHFILKEGDRCPFLNTSGLCDIICNLGEDALCDICSLHPRFSNFYEDFTETGLGLCCEEAVRIVLTQKEKFSLCLPDSVKDDAFFTERQSVFDILQNRKISFLDRINCLCEKYNYKFSFLNNELYDFYMSLERLETCWEDELCKIKNANSTDIFERDDLQIFFEQLACYFVFRHFEKGVGFVILSCYVIGCICSQCESVEKMLDVVRMYSSEIEYSEENTLKVSDYIEENYFSFPE